MRSLSRRTLAALVVPAALAVPAALVAASASAAADTITNHAGPGSGPTAFAVPAGLSPVGTDGALLLADPSKPRIWHISPTGTVSTQPSPSLFQANGVAALADGGMLVAEGLFGSTSDRVRGFDAIGAQTLLVPGLDHPTDVLPMPDGSFLVANSGAGQILKVTGGSAAVLASAANGLSSPTDLSAAGDGSILVADPGQDEIFRLNPSTGSVVSIAGGTSGFSGDGGPAASAELDDPEGVAATAGGGFLIADRSNRRIRRVSPTGIIATAAGTGASGDQGDGGPATSATLDYPANIAVLPTGGFVISDAARQRVRRVDSADQLPREITPDPVPDPDPTPTPTPPATPAPTLTPPAPAAPIPPVPPALGKRVTLAAVRGTIRVRPAGSKSYVELDESVSVPVGSAIDATQGTVRLQSARDAKGTLQAADFSDGAFTVRQIRPKSGPAITDLILSGGSFAGCKAVARRSSAMVAAKRKPVRRLWGSGHGRFRTKGRHSAATVRGTIWLTEERCEGTLTRVRRGVVSVRDLVRDKTIMVRTGDSYLARAKQR